MHIFRLIIFFYLIVRWKLCWNNSYAWVLLLNAQYKKLPTLDCRSKKRDLNILIYLTLWTIFFLSRNHVFVLKHERPGQSRVFRYSIYQKLVWENVERHQSTKYITFEYNISGCRDVIIIIQFSIVRTSTLTISTKISNNVS